MSSAGGGQPAIGSRRFVYDVTDSTSERAFAALAEGSAAHGDVHVAASQRAGRGRLGRRWESQAGEGLYLSAVLQPPRPLDPVALTMACGLAVLEAVRELGLAQAQLKWPNDVIVEGAKLAGILVESRGGSNCVLGIGLNVGQTRFSSDLERERPVTSLAMEGVECTLARAEVTLLGPLEHRYGQALERSPSLADDFLRAIGLRDQFVTVELADREWTGRLVHLDLERGLGLEVDGRRKWMALAHLRSLRKEEAAQ